MVSYTILESGCTSIGLSWNFAYTIRQKQREVECLSKNVVPPNDKNRSISTCLCSASAVLPYSICNASVIFEHDSFINMYFH